VTPGEPSGAAPNAFTDAWIWASLAPIPVTASNVPGSVVGQKNIISGPDWTVTSMRMPA